MTRRRDLPATCPTSSLHVFLLTFGLSTGQEHDFLAFGNRGRRSCSLYGYPGLAPLGKGGREIATKMIRDPSSGSGRGKMAVVLRPGGFAYAELTVSDHCQSKASRTTDLLVTPPNDRRSVNVPPRFKHPSRGPFSDFGVCAGSYLLISPVFAQSTPFYDPLTGLPTIRARELREGARMSVRCAKAQLKITIRGIQGGLSHAGFLLEFENRGPPCILHGYPGVDGLAHGHVVFRARRTRSGYLGGVTSGVVPSVLLHTRQTASALLEGIDGPISGGPPCHPYTALVVTPPNDYRSVHLPAHYGVCYPQIHPVVPGGLGRAFSP